MAADPEGFRQTMKELISVGSFSELESKTSREAWDLFQVRVRTRGSDSFSRC
jgi:hypothetical protein